MMIEVIRIIIKQFLQENGPDIFVLFLVKQSSYRDGLYFILDTTSLLLLQKQYFNYF